MLTQFLFPDKQSALKNRNHYANTHRQPYPRGIAPAEAHKPMARRPTEHGPKHCPTLIQQTIYRYSATATHKQSAWQKHVCVLFPSLERCGRCCYVAISATYETKIWSYFCNLKNKIIVMQLSNNQIIQNFRHGKYVYKNRINRGTEMCQEFWQSAPSRLPFFRK